MPAIYKCNMTTLCGFFSSPCVMMRGQPELAYPELLIMTTVPAQCKNFQRYMPSSMSALVVPPESVYAW